MKSLFDADEAISRIESGARVLGDDARAMGRDSVQQRVRALVRIAVHDFATRCWQAHANGRGFEARRRASRASRRMLCA